MCKVNDMINKYLDSEDNELAEELTNYFESKYGTYGFKAISAGAVANGSVVSNEEWRPHLHLGFRNSKYWGHYVSPASDGSYTVTVYENKFYKGLTGMDACEKEGRGPSRSIVIYPKGVELKMEIYRSNSIDILCILTGREARKYIKDNWED